MGVVSKLVLYSLATYGFIAMMNSCEPGQRVVTHAKETGKEVVEQYKRPAAAFVWETIKSRVDARLYDSNNETRQETRQQTAEAAPELAEPDLEKRVDDNPSF